MSTDELFNVGESLSPLAAWLKRNSLITVLEDPDIVGVESPESGDICAAVYVMKDAGIMPSQHVDKIGRGATQEEAAMDFAQRNGLTTWHQS